MITPKLDNLKPNTTVTEMLDIARFISTQTVTEKAHANKRHLCANVDQKIKSLLYIDWVKEEMKNQPKLATSKLMDLLLTFFFFSFFFHYVIFNYLTVAYIFFS